MCLAVPAKLIEHDGHQGIVDLHGNRLPVNTMMTPDAQKGDWSLIHAGFAIERLDPQEARGTWTLIQDVERAEQHSVVTRNNAAPGEPTRSMAGGPL